ncbi:tryptophan synthase subunit alpha [Candidatus Palauibacter sp.]|uniref:tryptophan synthase subunit alpha n=1 Tax=Candidatus Palauibacter sp. TaxID=3101350 RepID=UPI003B527AB1
MPGGTAPAAAPVAGAGSRIGGAFEGREGGAAFIPFLSSGFPRPADTPRLLKRLAGDGADIIELGIPFSDPLADGPTIQAASWRALEQGVTVESTLEQLAGISADLPPVVVFSYLNPILRMGVDRFLSRAEAAGAAGLLVTDLPVGSHPELERRLAAGPLDLIPLAAPTTPRDRLETILGHASGFLYYISRLGVTGAREALDAALDDQVKRLRKTVRLPVAVGFGISTPEQAAAVAGMADGVVVGSALIAALGRSEAAFAELSAALAAAVHRSG